LNIILNISFTPIDTPHVCPVEHFESTLQVKATILLVEVYFIWLKKSYLFFRQICHVKWTFVRLKAIFINPFNPMGHNCDRSFCLISGSSKNVVVDFGKEIQLSTK